MRSRKLAQLVEEARGRDVAVEDEAQKGAQVPVQLSRQRGVDAQLRRDRELAREQVPQRFQSAHRERVDEWERRRATRADGSSRLGRPRVRLLEEDHAALRALAQLDGLAGVIVGKAIYEGAFSVAEALEVLQGR